MIIILFILITITYSQLTTIIEQPIIQPYSYLQLGQVIGDYQKQNFKVGNLIVNQTLMSSNNKTFQVILLPYNDPKYPCLIQQFQFPNKTQNTQRCGFQQTDSQCLNKTLYVNQLNNQYVFYEGCYSISVNYFDDEINNNQQTLWILILINQDDESIIQLTSTYNIVIDNTISFYQISLVLCILLGIFIVISISVLCILNHKYQKIKQQNITLKLVNRTDDYQKTKLL
ncbi:unnamed protein product [Paramecium primaurelia]|uniref:Transmembrane protein n=1 Tax=Paramecium primaurelia TaxID=5886 RepID=A0A8S1K1X4_PARPR|nr:unnamed protein product [Paramecium primaurelia]